MNNALRELMQAFVNADYADLVDIANEALETAFPALTKIFVESDEDKALPGQALLHFIATTLAVDGNFTELEYKFYRDIVGDTDSYEDVRAFVANYADGKHAELADKLFDFVATDTDLKAALLKLSLAICAVDQTISVDEKNFICRLVD